MNKFTSKLAAEFLGTCALVFIGAGAVIVESHTGMSHFGRPDGKVGLIGIALAHGFVLMGSIFAFGRISGAHFNPAVSFAAWLRARIDAPHLSGYVVAQLAGALTAAVVLAGIFPDEIALAGLGTPMLAAKFTMLKGLVIETVITFLLVTVVLFVTRDERDSGFAGLAIGGTLVALILFAGPLTGAGANPARYLGPAAVSGNLKEGIVYVMGPLLGAALASLCASFVSSLEEQALADDGPASPSEPSDVPVAKSAATRPSTMGRKQAIRRARELFRTGRSEDAARELVPLLESFGDLTPDAVDSVRTLLLVIEEESGRMRSLDRYRHLFQSPPQHAAT